MGGRMTEEKVRELASNVNQLMKNYQDQQRCTAELFKICLEFLEEKKDAAEWGVGMKFVIADARKRRERKQLLIAAIHGYIKMIEEREKEDETE